MQTRIPDDVRESLARYRAREQERRRHQRRVHRLARAVERERRQRNMELAKHVLAFAREVAATGLAPSIGVQIYRSRKGRTASGALVYPDGELCVWEGSYMGGGSWRGCEPNDFAATSDTLLGDIVSAIESGAVWDYVRSATRR